MEVAGVAEVQVEAFITAPPSRLYDMVSDVTRMGSWSPETTSCRWVGGETEPVVGAHFVGANQHGWRRWHTSCTVVAADPGRRFGFDVTAIGFPISHWEYRFEPDGQGCRVVETWVDRRPWWMDRLSTVVMGISDRPAHNRRGMTTTLERLREAAEGAPAQ